MACHHAKRLYSLVMADLIIFLCHHLHSLVYFLKVRYFPVL